MDFRNPTEHITEALARAQRHWTERHGGSSDAGMPTRFSIAFSREAGTYGAAVAHEVGKRLGWPVYDHELLQRIADDMGVRRALVESVDERKVGWVSEAVGGLLALPGITSTAYFRQLVETMLSLATHGECVIVGRAATCVLPQPTTLRVRVVAPVEHRIDAVRREHGTTYADAVARVDKTDRDRNRFVVEHFQCDPKDPANYDLVLNAATFTCEDAADLVVAALARLREQRQPSKRGAERATVSA